MKQRGSCGATADAARKPCGPLVLLVAFVLLAVVCVIALLSRDFYPKCNNGSCTAAQPQMTNAHPRAKKSANATTPRIKGSAVERPSAENAHIVLEARKGRVVKWVHHEKPMFDNSFENYIASFIAATPGERFFEVDLGNEIDESFKASLTNNIVITADDSAEVAAIKTATIQAKEEIQRRAAEGMRPSEVLVRIRDEMNKIADMRDQLQDELNSILLKGTDPAEVLKFAKEANELLAEYDALPLEAPDDIEDAYDALDGAKTAAIEEIEAEIKRKKTKTEGD